jgi:hypothetical protein
MEVKQTLKVGSRMTAVGRLLPILKDQARPSAAVILDIRFKDRTTALGDKRLGFERPAPAAKMCDIGGSRQRH